MEDLYRGRLAALEQTWEVWTSLGHDLSEDQWSAATRCTGWDVAAVYAHHSATARDLDAPLPRTDAPGKPVTAAEIIRRFNAPDGVAHTMAEPNADQAVADAAEHPRRELVERFGVHGPGALRQLRELAATLVIPWPASGAVVAVGEAIRIILMEATVHLLDVQRALDLAPDVPPAALRDTALLLAEVAPAVELIEAATGRSPHSPLPVLR
ncbi:maleylpyruvate isomerase N-terminal domain-containing protein [Amycolatopsis anabasis]|uniref:maleylpyruvate isomerase N-terminal domain-containing protein n=1 Tax=Amycolatopsis anabasis TaxID=1840409 RepID=UPI00131D1047|nr:maleylpyruvate isomerase N-terminal domain-containing protein [Amycolatopsis anabasis]